MIKIRVTVDRLGSLILCPISPKVCKRIGESNQYDGSHEVYIQDSSEIGLFCCCRYPQLAIDCSQNVAAGLYRINDGAVILMDEWEYRHMVGGQSD